MLGFRLSLLHQTTGTVCKDRVVCLSRPRIWRVWRNIRTRLRVTSLGGADSLAMEYGAQGSLTAIYYNYYGFTVRYDSFLISYQHPLRWDRHCTPNCLRACHMYIKRNDVHNTLQVSVLPVGQLYKKVAGVISQLNWGLTILTTKEFTLESRTAGKDSRKTDCTENCNLLISVNSVKCKCSHHTYFPFCCVSPRTTRPWLNVTNPVKLYQELRHDTEITDKDSQKKTSPFCDSLEEATLSFSYCCKTPLHSSVYPKLVEVSHCSVWLTRPYRKSKDLLATSTVRN